MAKKRCTVLVGDLSSESFYCEDVDGKQIIKVKSQSSVDPIGGDIPEPTPSTPSNPPSNPSDGSTHIETYNNGAIIYDYDAGTASWSVSVVLPNDGLKEVADDPAPRLGGELDADGNNIVDLGDVTFKTGATGGTLRTGTSNADKFELQAYDVNDGMYRKVLEVDAGNDVSLELFAESLKIWSSIDESKELRFDFSGATTSTLVRIINVATGNRSITLPDADGTLALTSQLHNAVTVTDSSTIDFTLAGQNITASVIDNSITFAKMQDISANHLIGRYSAGSGDPQQIHIDGGLSLSGSDLRRSALTGAITASEGSNTTSLGSFTKAQLDGAISDGNVVYDGDGVSNLTNDANYISAGDNVSTLTNDIGYVAAGDNVSSLTNDANYISAGDNVSDLANDASYVSAGDNVSSFTNDANYLSSGDNVSELANDADYISVGDNVSSLTNDANYVSVGDNVSDLANDAGYTTNTGTVTSVGITPTDGIQVDSGSPVTGSGSITLGINASALRSHINVENGAQVNTVDSVNSQTGAVVLDADDIDDTSTTNKFVTAAEKSDIASAVQPGDNVSGLTNDANYLSSGDNVSELANDADYVSVGDNVSSLTNDANYAAFGMDGSFNVPGQLSLGIQNIGTISTPTPVYPDNGSVIFLTAAASTTLYVSSINPGAMYYFYVIDDGGGRNLTITVNLGTAIYTYSGAMTPGGRYLYAALAISPTALMIHRHGPYF